MIKTIKLTNTVTEIFKGVAGLQLAIVNITIHNTSETIESKVRIYQSGSNEAATADNRIYSKFLLPEDSHSWKEERTIFEDGDTLYAEVLDAGSANISISYLDITPQ